MKKNEYIPAVTPTLRSRLIFLSVVLVNSQID